VAADKNAYRSDRRLLTALRAVYGAPPAETVDWWSLRRRIAEQAGFGGVCTRTLWDRALWRRALLPVTFAATILMALAIADTHSTMTAMTAGGPKADSTEVAAWLRAASAGNSVTPHDLDPLLDASARIHGGQDAWLGAAILPTSD
jgi:hypothetical protein